MKSQGKFLLPKFERFTGENREAQQTTAKTHKQKAPRTSTGVGKSEL